MKKASIEEVYNETLKTARIHKLDSLATLHYIKGYEPELTINDAIIIITTLIKNGEITR